MPPPQVGNRAIQEKPAALPERVERGDTALPPGASQDWWSQVQKQIRAEVYEAAWVDDSGLPGLKGAWKAPNRSHGFETYFTETGVRVARRVDGHPVWEWGLQLVRWGREGAWQEVTPAPPLASGNRVEMARGAIHEWYINDERGLEQGFTIPAPPADSVTGESTGRVGFSPPSSGALPTASGTFHDDGGQRDPGAPLLPSVGNGASPLLPTLHIDLALTGSLRPVFSENGQAVDFYLPAGNMGVLHYGQLKVTDATGAVLPSRFEGWCGSSPSSFILHPSSAASGGIRIAINDTGAVYPITVDPLATSAAWTATGQTAGDNFGYSVATAGDVNGDGYSDVIVGANFYDSDVGKAYLYLGGVSGLSTSASWTAQGDNHGYYFGQAVATAGDVNGDGYSDVVVGCMRFGSFVGRVYLYLGGASGLSGTASWTATGEVGASSFGCSVATAGDVNGDGYSDVIVGAWGYSGYTGRAYLYLGGAPVAGLSSTASWTATGQAAGDYFGCSVAAVGDVNGDGYSDVAVGAYASTTFAGKAYVYLGGASGLLGTASWTTLGEAPDNHFGWSVATAGDVNGDGYSDVVVGAQGFSSYTGKAYLYLGGASGLSSTASWTASGETTNNRFGARVAIAGDVNGDGYSDVIVGAYGFTTDIGKAYLYLGGPSGLSAASAWTALGEATDNSFGWSVATAGDVNGDGYSDVVVGAYGYSSSTGRAYLYLGGPSGLSAASSWTASGEAASNYYGYSLASAGDVNGDGYSDVIVGAYANTTFTGKAYVYLGGPSGLSVAASWTAVGEATNSFFGNPVASAGDVNGDGYSDVIVGAYGYSTYTGRAYLYLGGPSGLSAASAWTASGEATNNYFGYSVASAGDVNGDGFSDVVVGAYTHTSNTGKAYVYLGGPSGLSAAAPWTAAGETTNNYFGSCVATAGDVNGDGFSDVIVGAYGNTTNTGRAYLYLGGSSGLSSTASWTASGEATNNYFGRPVAPAGDVNGDGYSDVVIGAAYNSTSTGKAYLYLGGPEGPSMTPSWTASGEATSNYFGRSVATAGDVNGDGFSDVIIGAYRNTSYTGKAYLYLGGPAGLSTSSSWSAAGEVTNNYFGFCVATAGDVNGDGHSDVVVGAYFNSSTAGKAYLYMGNGEAGGGVSLRPMQLRSNGITPIAPLGLAYESAFRIGLKLRSPVGRNLVRMEWQVAPLGGSFDGVSNPIQREATWWNSGLAGTYRKAAVTLPDEPGPYMWRARIAYFTARCPFQSHGPWLTPVANGRLETDLRNTSDAAPPACALPDEPCWLYSVVKVDTNYTLNWQDPNQSDQRTGWNIRRSNDASLLPKTAWPLKGTNVVDMDVGAANYQWTDHSGDDPTPGTVWYYEVTTYNNNCPAEGPF
jgi:hypothetical protein